MKNICRRILLFLQFLGFNPIILYENLKYLRFYYRDLNTLKKQKGDDTLFSFGRKLPILNERFSEAGTMKGEYFHQDLYVARQIFFKNPQRHIDIGSRINGFVAHVASFRKIELIDIREINSEVENISFMQADLMKLPENMKECCDSISSLHAIEHFGLGRYNDPIDYFGYLKAINNIATMLKPKGIFYFSVPIGSIQIIEFNAHRIFSIQYLKTLLSEKFSIQKFSYVDEKGNFHQDIELSDAMINNNLNGKYGCGIFELIKKELPT